MIMTAIEVYCNMIIAAIEVDYNMIMTVIELKISCITFAPTGSSLVQAAMKEDKKAYFVHRNTATLGSVDNFCPNIGASHLVLSSFEKFDVITSMFGATETFYAGMTAQPNTSIAGLYRSSTGILVTPFG